ncbi:hypothetical protein EVAR_33856_1 [Eumeta japonica]|uniref:Secreted protein n=1 Tax=Eumeta variegata TaxID=151549 RepID=A0A4C1X445_EUMVA|nr:hypothetical protein EVAR_33856_1 [Eumeta japonica]
MPLNTRFMAIIAFLGSCLSVDVDMPSGLETFLLSKRSTILGMKINLREGDERRDIGIERKVVAIDWSFLIFSTNCLAAISTSAGVANEGPRCSVSKDAGNAAQSVRCLVARGGE